MSEHIEVAYVSKRLLFAAAQVCNFPSATIGRVTVVKGDRGAWRYVVKNATAPERLTALHQLHQPLLQATPYGRDRLRHASHYRWDDDLLPYSLGDRSAIPTIKGALALLPGPVRTVLVREIVFIAIGRDTRGLCAPARFAGSDGVPKRTCVVLGPAADVPLTLHELGHAWHVAGSVHDPFSDVMSAISAEGEANLESLAEDDPGFAEEMKTHKGKAECLADALCAVWLTSPPPGDARPA